MLNLRKVLNNHNMRVATIAFQIALMFGASLTSIEGRKCWRVSTPTTDAPTSLSSGRVCPSINEEALLKIEAVIKESITSIRKEFEAIKENYDAGAATFTDSLNYIQVRLNESKAFVVEKRAEFALLIADQIGISAASSRDILFGTVVSDDQWPCISSYINAIIKLSRDIRTQMKIDAQNATDSLPNCPVLHQNEIDEHFAAMEVSMANTLRVSTTAFGSIESNLITGAIDRDKALSNAKLADDNYTRLVTEALSQFVIYLARQIGVDSNSVDIISGAAVPVEIMPCISAMIKKSTALQTKTVDAIHSRGNQVIALIFDLE